MKFKHIFFTLLLIIVIGAGTGCKKFVDVTNPDTLTDLSSGKQKIMRILQLGILQHV